MWGGAALSDAVAPPQDRTNLAFAALQLNRDLGFSELVYGVVSTLPVPPTPASTPRSQPAHVSGGLGVYPQEAVQLMLRVVHGMLARISKDLTQTPVVACQTTQDVVSSDAWQMH